MTTTRKGFHALEKRIHDLEEHDREAERGTRDLRNAASDDEERERERAAATVPPAHEE